MSFTDVVKEEICKNDLKKPPYRKAVLFGALWGRGGFSDAPADSDADGRQRRIQIRTSRAVAKYLSELISFTFRGATVDLSAVEKGRLTVEHPQFSALLRRKQEGEFHSWYKELCQNCDKAQMTHLLLAGIFLVCGRVADPEREFRLEFSVAALEAEVLFLLETCGFIPASLTRREERILYFKGADNVIDVLTALNAQQAAFEVTNHMIERSVRNNANRMTNCDQSNIEKSLRASDRQVEVIRRLMDADLIKKLPYELRVVAELRHRFPELPLEQLAKKTEPPISKSGLYHRLRKIMDEAENLLPLI